MFIRSLLFALTQVSGALAQTALTSPITSMVAHIARNSSVAHGFRWNAWEAEIGFAFDKVTTSSIKSGDYFEFTIEGPLASYSESSDVPLTYDFYIEDENNDQLFHVTNTDDDYSLRATATAFFDNPPGKIFSIAGTFSVDLLLLLDTPAEPDTITVGSFDSPITYIEPTPLTTARIGEKVRFNARRSGEYFILEIISLLYGVGAQPVPVHSEPKTHRVEVLWDFAFEPVSTHPWGMVDAYYISSNLERYDAEGSPLTADAVNNGSFTSASEFTSRLDWDKMPPVSENAAGLFISAQGRMSGTNDTSCFYYTGNYRYAKSLTPCVSQGRGRFGLPNGVGLAA